jgi:hypothetical protein
VLVLCCAKRQIIPRSRGTDPEPAVPARAHGTDGVGPALLSPDGAPTRWLLMDGYAYDIRDNQDRPPWQEGPLGVAHDPHRVGVMEDRIGQVGALQVKVDRIGRPHHLGNHPPHVVWAAQIAPLRPDRLEQAAPQFVLDAIGDRLCLGGDRRPGVCSPSAAARRADARQAGRALRSPLAPVASPSRLGLTGCP